jgi:hypothetical protein
MQSFTFPSVIMQSVIFPNVPEPLWVVIISL